MNRSASQAIIGSSRGNNNDLSRRCIYINEQVSKKTEKNSIQTIFHSPFKDGRPNKDYSNPTFMSSDIINNRQFSPFSSHTPKKAILHTEAENKQKALYNQRMNRSQSFTSMAQRVRQCSKSLKKKAQVRQAVRGDQGANTKVIFNTTLQSQLQGLMQYKKERELKEYNRDPNERFFRKNATNPKKQQLPVYLQKFYKNPHYIEQQQQKKKHQLQEWLGLSKQLQNIKDQIKKEKQRIQVNTMAKNVESYQALTLEKELMKRKNAQLLNRILLEQIRVKERENVTEKRERGWRVF